MSEKAIGREEIILNEAEEVMNTINGQFAVGNKWRIILNCLHKTIKSQKQKSITIAAIFYCLMANH